MKTNVKFLRCMCDCEGWKFVFEMNAFLKSWRWFIKPHFAWFGVYWEELKRVFKVFKVLKDAFDGVVVILKKSFQFTLHSVVQIDELRVKIPRWPWRFDFRLDLSFVVVTLIYSFLCVWLSFSGWIQDDDLVEMSRWII
jgi:hypothetical protein